jgi:pyrimidine-nucleoside phosphorylase
MISGRGLGPTGGTLDKLESIPGFRTDLTIDEIQATVAEVGCVITGASERIAPADRKLYALRDVTATVASIPLITASIMSKKLAEGLSCLVLDVKFGSGAFMKTREQACALATSLTNTGKQMGVATSAHLTDMNQPLGRMIGNSVEVNESVDVLRGGGPSDLIELTIALGADLLVAAGRASSFGDAGETLQQHLSSGRAWEKFREMVTAQGGDINAPCDVAPAIEVAASRAGYVARIHTEQLGQAVIELGGGRKVMTDMIDHAVGLEMLVKLGDPVEVGQPLVRMFARTDSGSKCRSLVESCFVIADERPEREALGD